MEKAVSYRGDNVMETFPELLVEAFEKYQKAKRRVENASTFGHDIRKLRNAEFEKAKENLSFAFTEAVKQAIHDIDMDKKIGTF